jgi:hypothetical protein
LNTPETELIEDNGDLYLKAFLLDTSTNVNGWGVNNATIDQNIKTFIGKPFVLQDDFGHPMSNDTYDHHLQYQEGFRIGNIAQIVSKDGIYSALIKVTDKIASDGFKAGQLPLYVSPQIYHYDVGKEPDDNASGWKGTHLAVVDQPAYGVAKARIISQCQGEEGVCMAQLANAKLKETKCNCVKQAITNYSKSSAMSFGSMSECMDSMMNDKGMDNETAKARCTKMMSAIVTKNKTNAGSSLENKTQIKYVEDNANANVQAPSIEEFEKLKTENSSLKTALSEKDSVTSTLKSSYDEALKRIDSIEKNTRTEKIANILSGVKFETDEERNKKIETLTNSNLEVSFIDETYKPLREAVTATKSAGVESKLELKDANTETDSSVPNWLVTFRNSGGSY